MEHLQLRITNTRQETPESKTFFVEEVNKRKISYRAGQFLTLLVDLHNKEVRRSYSISSTPGVDEDLFFTIKRIENGELSRYLFDELQVDDIITSLPPSGRFTIQNAESKVAVFIAAGSGVTPVFSLIKHLLHFVKETNILLINQNHSEYNSIFRSELMSLATRYPNRFTLKEIFSHPVDHAIPARRLNNNLLENILLQELNTSSAKFYLCGPESFMRMVQFTLKVMKFGQEMIRQENFFAIPPPPPFLLDKKPHNVTIHFRDKVHQLEVAYPSSILDAAIKKQIQLPYSCKGGRCSTCTARCISGSVKMTINDVLTPQDLQQGLILTCVSYPETDVELTYSPPGADEELS